MESNKSIKWCPVAGCGRAVRLPEAEQTGNRQNKAVPVTSHAVDCGNAHFFCWECLGNYFFLIALPCCTPGASGSTRGSLRYFVFSNIR